MKLALIADIHSNADALKAVLDAASEENVDALLVAGDLVGYYFEPAAVCKLLESWPKQLFVVKGNHEDLLKLASTSVAQLTSITKRYGPGISIALQELSLSDIDWLYSLPHPLRINFERKSLILCHGSPKDINQYVYPDSNLQTIVPDASAADIIVMGHTHYPMVKFHDSTIIINPGSVGQPRNKQPGAHWGILNTSKMEYEHRIEEYNIDRLVEMCQKFAPSVDYLSSVLLRR